MNIINKNFYQDKFVRLLLTASGVVAVIQIILLARRFGWSGENISLHYNIYLGPDWFGPSYFVYFYPAVGLAVLLINFLLSSYLWAGYRWLSYLVLFFSFCFVVFLLLSSLALIYYLSL